VQNKVSTLLLVETCTQLQPVAAIRYGPSDMARVFLSHSNRDLPQVLRLRTWLASIGFVETFIDFDKHSGIPVGAHWERELYVQLERTQAVIILLTENWLDSKWCFAEYTQARALGKPLFVLIEDPKGVPAPIAPEIQRLDLTEMRAEALEQLRRELEKVAIGSQNGFDWDDHRAPYPGLLSFDKEDAAVFFGRDDDIQYIIERINARRVQGGQRLLAILGSSGSGKSSLLKAGILPRLERDSRNYIVCHPFRPGVFPEQQIFQVLQSLCPELATKDFDNIDQPLEALKLLHRIRKARGSEFATILLSVDQGEEFFTRASASECEKALIVLANLLRGDNPIFLLLTLRTDHLADLQGIDRHGLFERFDEFSLKRMPIERIRLLVEGPAKVAGLTVDPALAAAITRDAVTEDALPLVAFVLRRMHDKHSVERQLTLTQYESMRDGALSPLEVAIRDAANDALTRATPSEAELVALRDAFIPHLVKADDSGGIARQSALLQKLPAQAHRLLHALADARLLVIEGDKSQAKVEVAHEALFRTWPQLSRWIVSEREFLLGKLRIARALLDYSELPEARRAVGYLNGILLDRAGRWLSNHPERFSREEADFIKSSVAEFERVAFERETEREQARAAELARAKAETERALEAQRRTEEKSKASRRLFWLASVAALGFAILSGVVFDYNRKANIALDEANASEAAARVSQSLAAAGAVLSSMNTEIAPNPAVEILRKNSPLLDEGSDKKYPEFVSAAYRGTSVSRSQPTVFDFSGGNWRMVSGRINFSPDGSLVTVPLYTTWAAILDSGSKRIVDRLQSPWKVVHQLIFNSDGSRLFLRSFYDAAIYDSATGLIVRGIKDCKPGHHVPFVRCPDLNSGYFNSAGTLVTAHKDGFARKWDKKTFRLIGKIGSQRREMRFAQLTDDEAIAVLVYGRERGPEEYEDERIDIVAAADSKVLYSYPDKSKGQSLGGLHARLLTPKLLLIVEASKSTILSLDTFKEVVSFDAPPNDYSVDEVSQRVAFLFGNVVRLFDLSQLTKAEYLIDDCGPLNGLALAKSILVVSSAKGTICTLNAETGARRASRQTDGGSINQLAASPKADVIVAASANNTVRLWSLRDFEELMDLSNSGANGALSDGSIALLVGYDKVELVDKDGNSQPVAKDAFGSGTIRDAAGVSSTGSFLIKSDSGCVVFDPKMKTSKVIPVSCRSGPDIHATDKTGEQLLSEEFGNILTVTDLRLLSQRHRGWLGLQIVNQKGDSGTNESVISVSNVTEGSPAAGAKIAVGDTIKRMNGAALADAKVLAATVGSLFAGDPIELTLERGGTEFTSRIVLAAKERDEPPPSSRQHFKSDVGDFAWSSFDKSGRYILAKANDSQNGSLFAIPFSGDDSKGLSALKVVSPFLKQSQKGDIGVTATDELFWTKEKNEDLVVWKATPQQPIRVRTIRGSAESSEIFSSADSDLVAFVFGDNSVQVHSLKNEETHFAIPRRSGPIASVAFSKNSDYVVIGESAGSIGIWSIKSGVEVARIELGLKCVSIEGRSRSDPSSCVGRILFPSDYILIQKRIGYSNVETSIWLRWKPDADIWKAMPKAIYENVASVASWSSTLNVSSVSFGCKNFSEQNNSVQLRNWSSQLTFYVALWRQIRIADAGSSRWNVEAKECRALTEREPTNSGAWYNLSLALFLAGDLSVDWQNALTTSANLGSPFGLHALADSLLVRRKGFKVVGEAAVKQLYSKAAQQGLVLSQTSLAALDALDGSDPNFCSLRKIASTGEPLSSLLLAQLLAGVPGYVTQMELPLFDGKAASMSVTARKRDLRGARRYALQAFAGFSAVGEEKLGKKASLLAWDLSRALPISIADETDEDGCAKGSSPI
jgi:WD40 repeat protein